MTNLILCGGSGTRLWPLSRELWPKQFLPLFEGRSLFELCCERNAAICDKIALSAATEHEFIAYDLLKKSAEYAGESGGGAVGKFGDAVGGADRKFGDVVGDAVGKLPTASGGVDKSADAAAKLLSAEIFLEPCARNTAAAVVLACMQLPPDEIILMTPSDHLITDRAAYQAACARAKELANAGAVVVFGLQPSAAHTGYGYIKARGEQVLEFAEKPCLADAERYVRSGEYFYNSGMCCFKAGVLLEDFALHQPGLFDKLSHISAQAKVAKSAMWPASARANSSAASENIAASGEAATTVENPRKITYPEAMSELPNISLDDALLVRSKRLACVLCDIGWSDLGDFKELAKVLRGDEVLQINKSGEIVNLPGKSADSATVAQMVADSADKSAAKSAPDTPPNFVLSQKPTALIGVGNLCVIDTADALLIADLDQAQSVKTAAQHFAASALPAERECAHSHRIAHRPWGEFEVLETAPGYKIKKLRVLPGRRLSLQRHLHRNEHWIVLAGTASVEVAGQRRIVCANESVYIKAGELHRLGNEGKIDLVIIEAQVGEYTGEDDIERVEDDYARD